MEIPKAYSEFTEGELLKYLHDLFVTITVEGESYDKVEVTAQFLFRGLINPSINVRRVSSSCLSQLVKNIKDHPTLLAILKPQSELLLDLLNDDEEVAASLIKVVKELRSPYIVGPKLLPLITYPYSSNVKISNIAIEALAELGYEPVLLHFRQLLQKTNNLEKRYVILNALFNNREKFNLRHVKEIIIDFLIDDPGMGLMPEIILEEIEKDIRDTIEK